MEEVAVLDEDVERIFRLEVGMVDPREEESLAAKLSAKLVGGDIVWIVGANPDGRDAADRLAVDEAADERPVAIARGFDDRQIALKIGLRHRPLAARLIGVCGIGREDELTALEADDIVLGDVVAEGPHQALNDDVGR